MPFEAYAVRVLENGSAVAIGDAAHNWTAASKLTIRPSPPKSFEATELCRVHSSRFADVPRMLRDLIETRSHRVPELRELDARLAMEHRPAKPPFQRSNRVGQRRLRHAAASRRAGEVQLFAERQEIPNLGHFHDERLSC